MDDQVVAILREQVGGIVLGAIFLFTGLAAFAVGMIRGGDRYRILRWQGIFASLYGLRILAEMPAAFSVLPRSTWPARHYVIWIISYAIILPALLFWLELSLGKLRRLLQITFVAALVVAIAGTCLTLITGSPAAFMPVNHVLAIWALLILAVANAVPSLARKFLVIQSEVTKIGTLVLAVAVLYVNLEDLLHLPGYPLFEPLAFAVFILSLGYVAAERVFAGERRLHTIESELAIARDIQNSILPNTAPRLVDLSIYAAYRPMTAVAGDFYDFTPVDRHRAGILVADVSGHGVPAALIAAMIKVALQSVLFCAFDPPKVLQGLNRILAGQLQSHFVSAAYLWFDTDARKALYSAAGHPPLLRWREGKLERIESNGLLIGIKPDSEYPVCELSLNSKDRYLLCTDGVVEPENAAGVPFGERQLEQIISDCRSQPPAELSERLLAGIQCWQPASASQQDDITLIIVDVA